MQGHRSAVRSFDRLTAADSAGPIEKAKDAVDPDRTLGKAAKGAARKATIGVRGNRCDLGETTRDTLGLDDRERDAQSGDGPAAVTTQELGSQKQDRKRAKRLQRSTAEVASSRTAGYGISTPRDKVPGDNPRSHARSSWLTLTEG
jgi:hypothetical protein